MSIEEKKYEVLPGTSVPDIKTILNAASDFSTPGVDSIEIKGMTKPGSLSDPEIERGPATEEEIKRLQELGNQVSEEEERAAAESRRKMEAIKNSAVIAPESLTELRQRASENVNTMSEEKRQEIEKTMKEQAEREAEEEAKRKAREERRALQKAAMEQSRAKKEAEAKVNEEETSVDEEPQAETAASAPADSGISSSDETMDDFSEFL